MWTAVSGAHRKGTASRYTRTHLPVVLVHREECGSRAQALTRECAVKALSRKLKEELIRGGRAASGTGAADFSR